MADVLFGSASPCGKLPFTVPRATGDLPPFSDYGMRGRTYRFAEKEPLYPFGFGLAYGKVSYEGIELGRSKLSANDSLTVKVGVRYDSDFDFDHSEVVECYVVPPRDWPEAPKATLVGFEKAALEKGGTVEVKFKLSADAFLQIDACGRKVAHPGKYGIVVGSCSPGERGVMLGAPKSVEAFVEIV